MTLPSSPPVTMQVPSLVEPRIAPPCTAMRCSAPSRQNSSVSSPSTKTGSSPRKWTATTVPPAATGRTRSAIEAVSVRVSLIRSGHALRKSLADHLLRHVAADEDGAAHARLAVLPCPLMIAVEDHVHALEHETLGVVLERENTLAAQDLLPLLRHQVLDPREELVGIERLLGLERERLHVLVVIVLEPAVIVTVAVIVVMVMTVVVIMPVAFFQEGRLDVENTVEIEGVAAKDLGQRDGAALRAVQPGVGIDPADARLDLAQVGVADEIGLVDQDHVGEGDLVLRLGRVAQPVFEPLRVRNRHHGVELCPLADVLVDEEGLRHRRRIGQAGGLDDDGVELALAPHQPVDDADQIAA